MGGYWLAGSARVAVTKWASTDELKSPCNPILIFLVTISSVQSHNVADSIFGSTVHSMLSLVAMPLFSGFVVQSEVSVQPRKGLGSLMSDFCLCSNADFILLCWNEPRSCQKEAPFR